METLEIMPGMRFGRLITVRKDGPRWICDCDCGATKPILTGSLRNGDARSCTCLKRELASARSRTHGKTNTREHLIWRHMKQRCYNPNRPDFARWGGRGIRVCDRWLGPTGFVNFLADMGPRPSPKHTLDRYPNNDGNYEPDNIRWATRAEQLRNTTRNVWITFEGERKVLTDWALAIGVKPATLRFHFSHGGEPAAQAFIAAHLNRASEAA